MRLEVKMKGILLQVFKLILEAIRLICEVTKIKLKFIVFEYFIRVKNRFIFKLLYIT